MTAIYRTLSNSVTRRLSQVRRRDPASTQRHPEEQLLRTVEELIREMNVDYYHAVPFDKLLNRAGFSQPALIDLLHRLNSQGDIDLTTQATKIHSVALTGQGRIRLQRL